VETASHSAAETASHSTVETATTKMTTTPLSDCGDCQKASDEEELRKSSHRADLSKGSPTLRREVRCRREPSAGRYADLDCVHRPALTLMRRPSACGILLSFLISSGGCFEIKEDGLDREGSELGVLKVDGRLARTVPLVLF
jgi:hypothetical protein